MEEKLAQLKSKLDFVTKNIAKFEKEITQTEATIRLLVTHATSIETETAKAELTSKISEAKQNRTYYNEKIAVAKERQAAIANAIIRQQRKLEAANAIDELRPKLNDKMEKYRALVADIENLTIEFHQPETTEERRIELERLVSSKKTLASVLFTEIANIAENAGLPIQTIRKKLPIALNSANDAELPYGDNNKDSRQAGTVLQAPRYGSIDKLSAKATMALKQAAYDLCVKIPGITPKQLCDILNGPEYAHLRPTAILSQHTGNTISEQTIRQWYSKIKRLGYEGLGFKKGASKDDVFTKDGKKYIIWENVQLQVTTIDDNPGVFASVEEYRNRLGKNNSRLTDQSYYARLNSPIDNVKSGYIHLMPNGFIDLTKSREFNVYRQDTPDRYATTLHNPRVKKTD